MIRGKVRSQQPFQGLSFEATVLRNVVNAAAVGDQLELAAGIHSSGDMSSCNLRSNLDYLRCGYSTHSCSSSFSRTPDHSHLHNVAVERRPTAYPTCGLGSNAPDALDLHPCGQIPRCTYARKSDAHRGGNSAKARVCTFTYLVQPPKLQLISISCLTSTPVYM